MKASSRRRPLRHAVPRWESARTAPFSEVLALGEAGRHTRWLGGLVPSLLAALGLGLWASRPAPPPLPRPPRQLEAKLVKLPPPPPPAPVREEAAPPPPPAPRRKAPRPPPAEASPPPPGPAEPVPTEAAQAGQVLARADATPSMSAEDFSLAVGAGLAHVGGLTAAWGTARQEVKGGSKGGGKEPGRVSRARSPWPVRNDWPCDWPMNVKVKDREATVRIRITAEGQADWVEVLQAPTPEFARVVHDCALTEKYFPARDEEGNPTAAILGPVRVRFVQH